MWGVFSVASRAASCGKHNIVDCQSACGTASVSGCNESIVLDWSVSCPRCGHGGYCGPSLLLITNSMEMLHMHLILRSAT
jgi:hypothetical protein